MKIKYTAEFIDSTTFNVYFDRKMLDKVENLYFYVLNNNTIIESLVCNKQTLIDDTVCFELKLTNPIEKDANYEILVCKNKPVKIKVLQQENQ